MKRRTQPLGHRDSALTGCDYDLMDPPSMEDRPTPIPVDRIMVIGEDIDGSEDAPTVAVMDLAELGIDVDDLRSTTPGSSRRPALKPYQIHPAIAGFETPEGLPVRDMSPVGTKPRHSVAPSDGEPSIQPLTLVAAASVPVVIAGCAAAWWFLAF